MRVDCIHPVLILHPLAYEYVSRYGNYTIAGQTYFCKPSKRGLYYFDDRCLAPRFWPVDHDNYEECYVQNSYTGKRYPLYLEVGCGKCPNCKNRKIQGFVQRCELESQLYNSRPIFCTLTYADENKPSDGLSVRDLQLFFKRFRQNMYRSGYTNKIRYVAVGEYGKPEYTHRPHYHLLLWNCGQTNIPEYRQIGKLIEKSWHNGFVRRREVDPGNNKTFYYTAKYLRKDCCIPDGSKPTFVCSSNRGGGIGFSSILQSRESIARTLDTAPKFLNKWSGLSRELLLSRYVLDRLFPSFSSVVSKVRRAVRDLSLAVSYMRRSHDDNVKLFNELYDASLSFFQRYFYVPRFVDRDLLDFGDYFGSQLAVLRSAMENSFIVRDFMSKGHEFFDRHLILDRLRERYLVKLFEKVEDLSEEQVSARTYRYVKSAAAAYNRQVL